MIDQILQTKKKKHVQDLNIVPILDMLTTVIFFLLMSTTFMEYTKLTLPPAASVVATGKNATQPVNPRLLLKGQGNGRFLSTLVWGGPNPDQIQSSADSSTLLDAVRKQVDRFAAKHPDEKTLQVSLERSLPYQSLISVMDGARERLPDIVLISYFEADQP
ncbi:MAG: biopolymer transporter ExbD [Bdellovibrionales bacterium]|nr:biopolymer transporter ExbD [Bdellovibrionales bacterium]